MAASPHTNESIDTSMEYDFEGEEEEEEDEEDDDDDDDEDFQTYEVVSHEYSIKRLLKLVAKIDGYNDRYWCLYSP